MKDKQYPKSSLPRLYFIDREIASGMYPNTRTMAEDYEVHPSTIERDIAFMRDRLNAPIMYNAKRRGYYYTEPGFRLAAGFAGNNDVLALVCTKTLLSLYRNTPFYDSAQTLLNVITEPFAGCRPPSWYENRIVVPPVASAPVPMEIWNTITGALRENRVISFEYKGRWDAEFHSRRVRPYQLLFDLGMWYLYSYDENRNAIRMFSLARMNTVRMLDAAFALPDDYDYCTGNSQSYFGVFAGNEIYRFHIIFYNASAVWIQERIWAADQMITPADGGAGIKFTSTQYDKVLEWVLSCGCTAYPLAPPRLADDWREHIKGMREMIEE
ncbi:MAG: WYL domain-containing protein [Treponema sp.]|nr:WYL domain-containing protein [Treponema sp.]